MIKLLSLADLSGLADLAAGEGLSFDTLEREQKQDKWILSEAAINDDYTLADILKYSDYLIAEECHPVLFELDLVNPELIPE